LPRGDDDSIFGSMNKKTRIYPILIVGAIVFAIVAVPVIAGGSDEEQSMAGESPPATEGGSASSPLAEIGSLNEAVEAAFSIPAEWSYDPNARYIYQEREEIRFPLAIDETVWLERLEPFEYYVLREQGTEYAFSNPMHESKASGIYYSRATGQPLFSSEDKYDSGTGWPSFTKPINPNAVVYLNDTKLFAPRIEVVDSLSGSHLGHVFPDGPAPTGQRYCMNAAALIFVPDGEEPPAFIQELQAIAAQ